VDSPLGPVRGASGLKKKRGGEKGQDALRAEGVLHHVLKGPAVKQAGSRRHLEVDLAGAAALAEGFADHLGEGLQELGSVAGRNIVAGQGAGHQEGEALRAQPFPPPQRSP